MVIVCIEVVMISVVIVMVFDQAVRRRVAVNQDPGVTVVFALMNVLGRSQWKQANCQADDACEHLSQFHHAILHIKAALEPELVVGIGSSGWIRTSNPPVNSRMLCR